MTAAPDRMAAFYDRALGQTAARAIGAALARLWPSLAGRSVLGIGHAAPLR
jgi:hypothetical protein